MSPEIQEVSSKIHESITNQIFKNPWEKFITCILKSVGVKCIFISFWLYYCLTDFWRYLKNKCLQKSVRIYFSPTDFMDFTDFWRYTPQRIEILDHENNMIAKWLVSDMIRIQSNSKIIELQKDWNSKWFQNNWIPK